MNKLMTLSDALIEAQRVGSTKLRQGTAVEVYIKGQPPRLFGKEGVVMPLYFTADLMCKDWSVVREPREIFVNIYPDEDKYGWSSSKKARDHSNGMHSEHEVKFREVLDGES